MYLPRTGHHRMHPISQVQDVIATVILWYSCLLLSYKQLFHIKYLSIQFWVSWYVLPFTGIALSLWSEKTAFPRSVCWRMAIGSCVQVEHPAKLLVFWCQLFHFTLLGCFTGTYQKFFSWSASFCWTWINFQLDVCFVVAIAHWWQVYSWDL